MEVDESAITIEAKAIRFGKNVKDGLTVVLGCHNEENFAALMSIPLNQSMYVSFVLVGDDGKPTITYQQQLGKKASARAHMMARDPLYWRWLGGEAGEEESIVDIRYECKVGSCSEFKDNVQAYFKFVQLEKSFEGWKKKNGYD